MARWRATEPERYASDSEEEDEDVFDSTAFPLPSPSDNTSQSLATSSVTLKTAGDGEWTVTGYTTERSSAYSWMDDAFDRKTTETVARLFYHIMGQLYEGERRVTAPVTVLECTQWAAAFPHLRVLGTHVRVGPLADDRPGSAEEIFAEEGDYTDLKANQPRRKRKTVSRMRRINSVANLNPAAITTRQAVIQNITDQLWPLILPALKPVLVAAASIQTNYSFSYDNEEDMEYYMDTLRDGAPLGAPRPLLFQLQRGGTYDNLDKPSQLGDLLQITAKHIVSRDKPVDSDGNVLQTSSALVSRPASVRVPSGRIRGRSRLAPLERTKTNMLPADDDRARTGNAFEGLRGHRLVTATDKLPVATRQNPLPPIADQNNPLENLRRKFTNRASSAALTEKLSHRLAPDLYSGIPNNTRSSILANTRSNTLLNITGSSLGGHAHLSHSYSAPTGARGSQVTVPEEEEDEAVIWTQSTSVVGRKTSQQPHSKQTSVR